MTEKRRSRNTRPSVVHVLGSLDRGGIEMRTLEVLKRLGPGRVSTTMVTLTGREGTLADRYRAVGARVVPMALARATFVPRFIRALRGSQVHCVDSHVYMASGAILLLARLAGVPNRIAHFQTDGAGRVVGPVRSLWYRIMRMSIDANATQIIGVSPSALEAWNPRWKSDARCRLEVHGVDLDDYAGGSTPPDEIGVRASEGQPVFAHVGRADLASKNRDGAIRVFAEYARSRSDGVLVFAGRDGSDEVQCADNRRRWDAIVAQNGLEGRVLFLGERDDVPALLAAADILLVTSTLEGLPGVVVEARAAGALVISYDLPGSVFIASILDGIECVPMGSDPARWTEPIAAALSHRPTPESRRASRDAIRGSVFDVAVSAERALAGWSR